jgi:rhodanese-related sulfurtransferase
MQELASPQAWAYLKDNPTARLVDVRTRVEWHFVGTPDISALGSDVIFNEWVSVNGTPNPDFLTALTNAADLSTPLLMLCRSGARSLAASHAAAAHGFTTVINISDGFEGDLDGQQHRGNINGWRHSGLAWRQS